MEVVDPGPIPEHHRRDLEARLVDNFYALLFHREGYRPTDVPQAVVEEIAFMVEAKAFSHVMRAADLGMSSRQVLQTYAKEASTLLLAEVEKFSVPLEQPAGHASSGGEVDPQQLSLNEFSGGLRSIHTAPTVQQRPGRGRDAAWGWLVPGSRVLPYVVLKGTGVAIGRGKEALWAVGSAGSSAGSPRSCLASGNDRHLTEVLKRNLGFVEVADGRVSRLHCIISTAVGPGSAPQVVLEDCSSNGTFLNHTKLAKGESVPLVDGDRISLVLSVAPLVEQFFTFHCGDPRDPELAGSEEQSWVGSTHSVGGVFSPSAVHSNSPGAGGGSGASILRTATSRYTTAEQSTLEDLRCQICLNTLRQCVALEPCGHNFCATCLSHHLGSQLQSGLQLSCPFRCPPPERIIVNYAVRALMDLLSSSGRPLSSHHHGPGRPPGRASRAGRTLQGAFGQQAGSSSSLHGLGSGAPPAAPSPLQLSSSGEQQPAGQSLPPASSAAAPPTPSAASQPTADAAAAAAAAAAPAPTLALPSWAAEAGGVGGARSRLGPAGGRAGADAGASAARAAAGSPPPPGAAAREDSADLDYFSQSMNLLCPLDDEHLPLEAANLKTRQVDVALSQLKAGNLDVDAHLVCLEALARLAWSDDGVREQIASSGGVKSLVEVMARHAGSDSIQCHGCLVLMSLVRGEGEVCQSNQWHVAKAGAIEVIASAMKAFRRNAMVQLSVLLCLIPLALENAMMQAHITQECLADIIAALDNHRGEVDIQTKGLVLLGVLIQGDDVVHDAIRIRELEAAVPRHVVAALRLHGASNDDVLWSALFVLAVLVRDSSCVFARATKALAWAGVLKVLQSAVRQYRQRHDAERVEPDEMIVSAGDYLVHVLEPVQAALDSRRLLALGALAGATAGAAVLLAGRLRGGAGGEGGGGAGGGGTGKGAGVATAVAALATVAAASAVVTSQQGGA